RGGWGASNGNNSVGGAGAGLGGAIFLRQGAIVTIAGPIQITDGSVNGGQGYAHVINGGSAGAGMFLHGNGTLTINPGAGQTVTISDAIADQGLGTGSWNLIQSSGTLVLSATTTYSGTTTVSGTPQP